MIKFYFFTFFTFLSTNLFSQCSPVIEYTTTSGTLSGCAPFTISFKDPDKTSTRLWDFGDGKTSSSQNPTHDFEAGVLGDTSYIVTLTKSCNGGVSTNVTVTVFGKPKVDFTADTTSVCAIYDKVNYKAISDPGVYLWNFGDNTSSTEQNPFKTYNTGGSHTVSLKVTNIHGCENTKTKVKFTTVNSLPSPDFVLNKYSGCVPLPVSFTNTTDTSVVQVKNWEWNLNNGGGLDNNFTPSNTIYSIPGTKLLTLTATSILGCKSSSSIQVHATSSPTADFTISPTEICSSDSLLVTYTGSAGVNANFVWSLNGGVGNPGVGRGPHWINWEKGGIKTINLTVTDSTCSATSIKLTTVLVSPVITFTASNDTICTGDEVSFTTTPASLVDYKVYKNGDLFQTIKENVFTTTSIASGDNFYVVASDVKGCKSRKSNTEKLVVKSRPSVSLLSSDADDIICTGDLVTFSGTPTNYSSYTFYNYSQPLQTGVSTTFKTSTLTDNDSIFVEATNFNGCSKTSSNAFVMHVKPPLPKPIVNCGASTDSQVSFVWGEISSAVGYEVSVNGGAFQSPSSGANGLSHVFGGLSSGDSTKIVVKALGSFSCATSLISKEKACVSKVCTPFSMKYVLFDTICNGETVKLRLDNISATNYSVTWNGSTPGKDTTFTFKPSVDTEITAVIKDSAQSSYCSTFDATFRIKVYPLPVVTLNSSLSIINCQGDVAKLKATPANYDSYSFYSGNELLQSGWKNYYTLKNVKNGVPLTVVAENFGCKASSVNTITNTVIQPLSQPVVNCGGSTTSSMLFTWDPIPNAIGYEISVDGGNWKTPSSGTSGLKHVLNGLTPGTAAYVSVRALGATVCGNSKESVQASCFTNFKSDSISCTPPMVSVSVEGKSTLCKGESTNLVAISNSSYTYQWYKNDTVIVGATASYLTIKASGEYFVSISNGLCKSKSTKFIIRVNTLPQASISVQGKTKYCEGDKIATYLTVEGGDTYIWNSGQKTASILVTSPGTSSVDVGNDSGCFITLNQQIQSFPLPNVIIDGLMNTVFKNTKPIKLYTSPVGGTLNGEQIVDNMYYPANDKIGKRSISYSVTSLEGCTNTAMRVFYLVDTLNSNCTKITYDTVTITNNVTKYDTVKVTKFDTVTVKNNVYDTVIVPKTVTKYDTITVTNNVTKYDTVKINKTIFDTVTVTKNVTKYDTLKVTKFDTITVKNNVYDTVIITNNVIKYDTITLTDTVSILKITFKLTTGIQANQTASMSVYPNPTTDILHIEVGDAKALEGYRYRILDALGKEVYNELVKNAITEIPLKSLGAAGMYQFEVLDQTNVSIQTNKIVLQ